MDKLERIFTALHGMQMRSSDKNSVCPSVCIHAKMIGGRRTLVREILSQSDCVGAKFEKAAITPKRG